MSDVVNTVRDEDLLAEFLAGQPESYELLVRRHSTELFRFLARFTGSTTVAEDLVQDAFLQVYLAAESFDRSRRFKPWLFTIAANKARDWMRSRGRRPEVPLDAHVGSSEDEGQRYMDFLADAAASPAESLEEEEDRELVRSVLARMPDHLREVLILGYYHRLPYKTIAEVLEVPLGTVKSRLHAAVGHFGKAYKAAMREQV
jgi:RNA polymerase sigma-70 factor (ECF subfamily)